MTTDTPRDTCYWPHSHVSSTPWELRVFFLMRHICRNNCLLCIYTNSLFWGMRIWYISNLLQEPFYGLCCRCVLAGIMPRLTLFNIWQGEEFNGSNLVETKLTRLTHLLSFASLVKDEPSVLSVEFSLIVRRTDR